MIEVRAPPRTSGRVAAIGEISRKRINSGAGPLSDEMNDDLHIEQCADVIARADRPVFNYHIRFADVAPDPRQVIPQRRQHRAQIFVERIGIQPVRKHDLRLRAA